jgi:hypothetical protein
MQDSTFAVMIYIGWGVILALTALLIVAMIGVLYHFKNALFRVYTVFLGLKEPSIRHIS